MKKAPLLLVLMTALCCTSCRIEKRIYSPGHYISAKQHNKTEARGSEEIAPVSQETSSRSRTHTHSHVDIPVFVPEIKPPQQDKLPPAVESQASTHTDSTPAVQEAAEPQKTGEKEAASDEGTKKGLWMIILGLLLLGIGYLISFLGVLGFIFFVIFAIGAAVYIIVGIFVIILS